MFSWTPLGVFDVTIKDPVDDGSTPEDVASARKFLLAEAALLGGVVAAPAMYALYRAASKPAKGKKRAAADTMSLELSHASTRATTLLSAFGPAFAIPATYITVQGLENAKYITKGLGDAVQALLTASAAAGLVGGVAGVITGLKK